jgi:hypothetical protein
MTFQCYFLAEVVNRRPAENHCARMAVSNSRIRLNFSMTAFPWKAYFQIVGCKKTPAQNPRDV